MRGTPLMEHLDSIGTLACVCHCVSFFVHILHFLLPVQQRPISVWWQEGFRLKFGHDPWHL
jgi:hypothetical protein